MASTSSETLTIVPCGRRKIWGHNPNAPQLVPARAAYTGNASVISRRYAERFGERWVILSAKHGLLLPNRRIRDYNVKLDRAGLAQLTKRLRRSNYLRRFRRIDVLGGRLYVEAVVGAVRGRGVTVRRLYPDGRRGWFDIQDALVRALETGRPLKGTDVRVVP